MAYNIILQEEAQADTLEAYLYYEDKLEGLGNKFLKALHNKYQQIKQNPRQYSYISADKEKTLRDVKINGFPYVIMYDIIENEVIVYAVQSSYKNKSDHYK